ncbi:sulfotransferase family 2 domain-containing protein [Limibaculum sp. M0105]|uniref:Sulfotransferase family 2 domain-containing protein n=1 Tax=Thermohalobaculum xanthum TaxID=2753746 RepID=A0A8J7SDZ9_9RHOB|nr:sulfotransferase family 2 domain-containing protein [Thermohalobaculum xanthum]
MTTTGSDMVTYDNRFKFTLGRLHLAFELGGSRIAYAYIRKNGCSSFKRALGFDYATNVRTIARAHPYRPWRRYDATIFVWRDPEERLLSLFRNKIIQRDHADGILASYRRVMGAEPATFEDFVRFACRDADPHCWPQCDHLMPIRYTHAIPLSRLYQSMCGIVGEEAAEPFVQPYNASVPYLTEVSDEARRLIRRHYAKDYAMIARLKRPATSH